MRVGQKIALSLLITILLFSAFAVLSFTGLFTVIQDRFYHPAVARQVSAGLDRGAQAAQGWFSSRIASFGEILAKDSVKRSFLPNQSLADITERKNLFGRLMEESGLEGVRFIDSFGQRIHFSTYAQDILSQKEFQVTYRNWGSGPVADRPYEELRAGASSPAKAILDGSGGRVLFCLPFTDSNGLSRGTAVFSVSLKSLVEALVSNGAMRLVDDVLPVGEKGFVIRMPAVSRQGLGDLVASAWGGQPAQEALLLAQSGSGQGLVLFSRRMDNGIWLGSLLRSSDLEFPVSLKIILLISFFLTVFLLVFLVFNIRQDSMSALRDRVKRFQIGLLEEYLERKGEIDFRRWSRELEARRPEVRSQIRQSIRAPKSRAAEVDELIDKSWDEILEVLGSKAAGREERLELRDLEGMLKRLLASGTFVLPAGSIAAPASKPVAEAKPVAMAKPVAENPEEPETILEAETADEPEAIEEAETVEEPEVLEEAAEEVEELEDATEPGADEIQGTASTTLDINELQAVPGNDLMEGLDEPMPGIEPNESPLGLDELDELEELEEFEEAGEPAIEAGEPAVEAGEPAVEAGEPVIEAGEPTVKAGEPVIEANVVEAPGADALLEELAEPEDALELEDLEDGEGLEELFEGESSSAGEPGIPADSGRVKRAFIVTGASIYEGEAMPQQEAEELEEDWDLIVGALDLSPLLGYLDGGSHRGRTEEESRLVAELPGAEAVAAEEESPDEEEPSAEDRSAGEIQMLSDSDREAVEELALADDGRSSEAPEEPICLGAYMEAYVPFFARGPESQVPSMRLGEGEAALIDLEDEDDYGGRGRSGGIVQDGDGVYSLVASRLPPGDARDESLKSLVDSVLGAPAAP